MGAFDFEANFFRRVARLPGGCHEWQASTNYGYGAVWDPARKQMVKAHRVAYRLTYGEIPKGLVVRHRCDNPLCVNPEHLELGTIADNMRDMVERGRSARGAAKPLTTKVSDEQVVEIRAKYQAKFLHVGGGRYRSNAPEIAAEYGISEGHVQDIAHRRVRVHVDG